MFSSFDVESTREDWPLLDLDMNDMSLKTFARMWNEARSMPSDVKLIILERALRVNKFLIANFIVQQGVDIKKLLEMGCNPVLIAAESGSRRLLKLALSKGVDINQQWVSHAEEQDDGKPDLVLNVKERTALAYTCRYGRTDKDVRFIKTLCKLGANPNLQSENGDGAFHDLCYNTVFSQEQMEEVVQTLLKYKATPLLRGAKMKTVFEMAPPNVLSVLERHILVGAKKKKSKRRIGAPSRI